jgi:hypothetical protein
LASGSKAGAITAAATSAVACVVDEENSAQAATTAPNAIKVTKFTVS